jgi:large subunit ribosomal protein L29
MKINEIKEKSDVELDKELAALRDKLRDLRFKIAARRLTDVREVRETRKTIARIMTVRRTRRQA